MHVGPLEQCQKIRISDLADKMDTGEVKLTGQF